MKFYGKDWLIFVYLQRKKYLKIGRKSNIIHIIEDFRHDKFKRSEEKVCTARRI